MGIKWKYWCKYRYKGCDYGSDTWLDVKIHEKLKCGYKPLRKQKPR